MRLSLIAVSICASQSLGAMNLSDAYKLGLQKNPQVQAAAAKLEQSKGLSRQAFGALAPEVSVSGSSFRKQDAQTSSMARFNGDSYNLHEVVARASVPLIQRGLINGVRAVNLQHRMGELDLLIAERDLGLEIIQAYYKVILNRHELATLEQSKKVREQSLSIAQRRSRIGRGDRLDVLQLETQIALLEPRIQKAKNEEKSAVANLQILTGVPRETALNLDSDFSKQKTADAYMKSLSADIRELPEIEKARLGVESTSLENTVAMSKHWPKLTGSAEISRSAYSYGGLTNSDANTWQLGLTLEIPLIKGGFSFFENQTLNAKFAQVLAEERSKIDEIERARVTANEELRSSKSVIEYSEKALELANASVKIARTDFKTSILDALQLLNTEQSLLDAQLALDQARYDFVSKLALWTKVYSDDASKLVEFLSN